MPALVRLNPATAPSPTDRRERLALNIADLSRVDPQYLGLLLAGRLDLKNPVRVDPDRIDEAGVSFVCDLLTAACITDVIRVKARAAGDPPVRAYIDRGGGWARLGPDAALTAVQGDRVGLDPVVFPPVVRPGDFVARAAERVEF